MQNNHSQKANKERKMRDNHLYTEDNQNYYNHKYSSDIANNNDNKNKFKKKIKENGKKNNPDNYDNNDLINDNPIIRSNLI